VVQPAKPSNWSNAYILSAEVYSANEVTRLGGASPGTYYTPGNTLNISGNYPGDITGGNNYKVRFVVQDTASNRYTYGPFTIFSTPSPTPSINLTKTTSSSGNTFQLSVTNGKGPFIYEWYVVRNGNLSRYLSSTTQTSTTFFIDSTLSTLNGFSTFKEASSGLNGPYDNSVTVYVNFVDKGNIGEGGGWWVKESNRLTVGP